MPRRRDGEETKNKILKAAAAMFARKGFRNTTNADIVSQCGGINTALINYYFSDKASLYRQVWQYSYQEAMKEFPIRDRLLAARTPEEKLSLVLENSLRRSASSNSALNGIIHQEISAMTGILTDLYARPFAELKKLLRHIISEILGAGVPEEEKEFAVYSIVSILLIPIHKIRSMENLTGREPELTLEERICHVREFVLGGLERIRMKYAEQEGNEPSSVSHGSDC